MLKTLCSSVKSYSSMYFLYILPSFTFSSLRVMEYKWQRDLKKCSVETTCRRGNWGSERTKWHAQRQIANRPCEWGLESKSLNSQSLPSCFLFFPFLSFLPSKAQIVGRLAKRNSYVAKIRTILVMILSCLSAKRKRAAMPLSTMILELP